MTKILTPKQKQAVESTAGQTIVIAGPGTGKTHILAARIEHLVKNRDSAPESILCLTFTDSAANEMRQRVIQFLGPAGYKVDINTFHSFAARLIDEHPEIFGYRRNLAALTDIDRARLIQSVMDELFQEGLLNELVTADDKYFYYYDIAKALSDLKREGFDIQAFQQAVSAWEEEFSATPDEEKISSRGSRKGQLKLEYEKLQKRIEKNKELAILYEHYQQKLKEQNRYDYEDMILQATAGLKKSHELRSDINKGLSAILVDEYQDTNGAQNKLLFQLIDSHKHSVFIVGDDDQAIYRFQGATITNFKNFTEHFKDANIIVLEDNFRSPQHVLDAALALADNNQERITKHLALSAKKLAARGKHAAAAKTFHINECITDLEEHAYLLEQLNTLHEQGTTWREIAILTRTNREQQQIAELLRVSSIPHSLSAQQNALTEPATASLFSLVRACLNPLDDENTLAFLLHPATPIKTEDVWALLAARKKYDSIYTTLHNHKDEAGVILAFTILNELSALQNVQSGAHWLQSILERTGFLAWALKQPEAPYIIANIRALTDEAKRVQAGNPAIDMKQLLAHFNSYRELNIPLKPDLSHFEGEDTVRVMTAHNAKGQEFENVFVVHAVHGNWSGKRTINKLTLPPSIPAQTESEEDARRLFYVALTRTKKNLFVSYAKTYTRGIDGMADKPRHAVPALFVTELTAHIQPKKHSNILENVGMSMLAHELKPAPPVNDMQREVVQNIVHDPGFALNATSFNAFIECPQKFLYESILRVPKVKTFSLTYGEAVHLALQQYFEGPAEKRTIDGLMQTVQMYLDRDSTLTEVENQKIFERAERSLINYLPRLQNEPDPVAVEYRFPKDKFTYSNIRLSGKIDKIAPLSANGVKVVDYKTSKKAPSLNAILGKTQDKHAPNLFRQLLFYKLLLATDEDFNHKAQEFSLDFVDVSREVAVPITAEEYINFQDQLKKVWNDIQTLEFLERRCEECEYCTISKQEELELGDPSQGTGRSIP